MSVIVFGSANMDLVVRSHRFPDSGETITGMSLRTTPGGKGANQAIAAARLGCSTAFVGRIGADAFGNQIRRSLVNAGVSIAGMRTEHSDDTGVAFIVVNDSAENQIIIVPGANAAVGPQELDVLSLRLRADDLLLVQLELDLGVVVEAIDIAGRVGATVIADPAPAPLGGLPDNFFQSFVILTPNQTEAAALVGYPIDSDHAAVNAASELIARGVGAVVITMGARGVCWSAAGSTAIVRPPRVDAVDTVGAGDAVNGALAAALGEGLTFDAAARWAVAAGALAVTVSGAQDAMPNRSQLLGALNDVPDSVIVSATRLTQDPVRPRQEA